MLQRSELKKEFIQIRPWDDCINKCHFCFLGNRTSIKTPVQRKKNRLLKLADLVQDKRVTRIGLIGGEFFEGQLKGCEDEWLYLINAIQDVGSELFITANLIHKQYLLGETIEASKGNLLLCTSYDEIGRFHTQEHKDAWFQRINNVHNMGANLFCTCIPTQEFYTSNVEFPEWLGINLSDPYVSFDWLVAVDKTHYREHLLEDNKYFNLPKRKSAIAWMRKHPAIVKNYASYKATHANTVYGFNKEDEIISEVMDRHNSGEYSNPNCGHPCFCSCYADSDKCMMCDAATIARQF